MKITRYSFLLVSIMFFLSIYPVLQDDVINLVGTLEQINEKVTPVDVYMKELEELEKKLEAAKGPQVQSQAEKDKIEAMRKKAEELAKQIAESIEIKNLNEATNFINNWKTLARNGDEVISYLKALLTWLASDDWKKISKGDRLFFTQNLKTKTGEIKAQYGSSKEIGDLITQIMDAARAK